MRENRRNQAAYRELGIRAVVRKLQAGESTKGFHGQTVKAAQRRLASGWTIPTAK